MKRKIILITMLIICLALGACSSDESYSVATEEEPSKAIQKDYLIGHADFNEDPNWVKTGDEKRIVYTNGYESMIEISYSEVGDTLDNFANSDLRNAQQRELNILRNDDGKISGYRARYLDYDIGEKSDDDYTIIRTVYIEVEDINDVYIFRYYDVNDGTFTDEDFNKLIDSIKIEYI